MGHVHQALIALAAALLVGVAAAQPVLPEGEKSLVAVTRDGQKTRIGAVSFRTRQNIEPAGVGYISGASL